MLVYIHGCSAYIRSWIKPLVVSLQKRSMQQVIIFKNSLKKDCFHCTCPTLLVLSTSHRHTKMSCHVFKLLAFPILFCQVKKWMDGKECTVNKVLPQRPDELFQSLTLHKETERFIYLDNYRVAVLAMQMWSQALKLRDHHLVFNC